MTTPEPAENHGPVPDDFLFQLERALLLALQEQELLPMMACRQAMEKLERQSRGSREKRI